MAHGLTHGKADVPAASVAPQQARTHGPHASSRRSRRRHDKKRKFRERAVQAVGASRNPRRMGVYRGHGLLAQRLVPWQGRPHARGHSGPLAGAIDPHAGQSSHVTAVK